MMIGQELCERDWENYILENVPPNAVLITSDEAHFHLAERLSSFITCKILSKTIYKFENKDLKAVVNKHGRMLYVYSNNKYN